MIANKPKVYRLENTVQHYDWGSYTDIAELLGREPSGKPEAELWLGAHPSAPSLATPWPSALSSSCASGAAAKTQDIGPTPLDQLIKQNPEQMLGIRVLNKFGPRLPFLLKILAADRALSLQVHPADHLARAGFNRENREQVPLTAPERSFRDANHKPEMIVAITEFHALAGLRAPRVVLRMLDGLDSPLFQLMRTQIQHAAAPNAIRTAFTELLALRGNPTLQPDLDHAIAAIQHRLTAGSQYQVADQTAVDLAKQYPGDVGALASYLLNRVTLQPGESLFLDDGEVHAYLKGLGVEVMANSDNVLRAGLTSKHLDVPALLECMSFHPKIPFHPERYDVGQVSYAFTYRPPVSEFALTSFDLHGGESLPVTNGGPRIIVVLDGEVSLQYGGATGVDAPDYVNEQTGRPMTNRIPKISGLPPTTLRLKRGDSVFAPDAIGAIELQGQGQAVCAWVP